MAWNNVKPLLKVAPRCVRLNTVQIRDGAAKSSISISQALLDEMGNPETVDVFIGEDDDSGKLLLQFDGKGDHKIQKLGLGGGARSQRHCSPVFPARPPSRAPASSNWKTARATSRCSPSICPGSAAAR